MKLSNYKTIVIIWTSHFKIALHKTAKMAACSRFAKKIFTVSTDTAQVFSRSNASHPAHSRRFLAPFLNVMSVGLLLAVVLTYAGRASATQLNSSNFRVTDYNLGYGGADKTTSTNYQLQPNIELVVDAKKSPPATPPTPPADTTPPTISNILVINITTSTATVTWTTNENSDSVVEYGPTIAYGSSASGAALTTSHSINLSGLTAGALYHFRVKSKDAAGNQATSGDGTFTTADNIPPVISNIQVINITDTGATVTWNTNESADSAVDYGLTASYGAASSSAALATSHGINLTNLTGSTVYHFRVKSRDAAGNQATSGDNTFTTADLTAPIISNIRVENITGVGASILWDTNEPATSAVNYGLDANYGSSRNDSALVTGHRIDLTGLTPDTTYHFNVISADAKNNSASSSDQTFKTLDTIPPVISNIQVINISNKSADITWVTNEATTSQVLYRRAGETAWNSAEDASLQVSHFLGLSGLIANIDYEFYIIARDAAGNAATSPIRTFHTLPDNISPSNIRNFIATPDDRLNVLTWQNPPDPDYAGVLIVRSTSTYPRNRFEGDIIYSGPGISLNDAGLTNGVMYYYTGFAYDTSFNFASGAITEGMPRGPLPPEEILPPPPIKPPAPPTIPAINLDVASFYVGKRTIQIYPDANATVETLAGIELGVSVLKNKLPADIELVTLRIDASNYLMKLRSDGLNYDADAYLPQNPGGYQGIITFISKNYQQEVRFNLDLRGRGLIFETVGGKTQNLAGASITLYELKDGAWRIWPAENFFQANPKVTLSDGAYYFLAPNGTYYLKITKENYRDKETNRFEITKNYINENFELLVRPKKIAEAIKPEAPLTENIVAVTKAIGGQAAYTAQIVQEGVINAVQNPIVERANAQVAAPALVSVAVINIATAVPFLNLFGYLQYLLTQPLLFFLRRKRKAWGVIYNAFTKLPLDLAIVRLIDAKLKRIIRTVVTDKQGRYLLFSSLGKLKMTATKPGFIFPSAYLKGKKEDEAYVDLYFGEEFEQKQEGQAIIYNMPMDPVDRRVTPRRLIWERALKGFQYGLSLSGIVLTAVSLIITPSVKIGLFLVLHIALFGLFLRLAKPAKFKKWGMAIDAISGRPIKNAIVRLFEPEYNKLLGTQITDAKGRYAFLVGRNIYYLTFEKAGYKTLRTKNIDMRTKAREAVITEKVKLEKNNQEISR